ncbi:MAG: PKD domain-containing protein, partial [Chloroflexi bacterium]|nr:PKD domain-containing protein [Chloroflexota bacterium]
MTLPSTVALVFIYLLLSFLHVSLVAAADDQGETTINFPENIAANLITVTSTADNGLGTLRTAMNNANSMGTVTITFDTAVFPPATPTTITLNAVLPSLITDNITIDASNAGVILDGGAIGAGADGFIIQADSTVIRGLTIQNFSSSGIFIDAGAANNIIGGDHTLGSNQPLGRGQGNIIINNAFNGVEIRGDNNFIRGNLIGVERMGTWPAANNKNGIAIWQGATNNTIGGTLSGYRNVIGGNGENGVWIGGSGTNNNQVIGNYLGTRVTGMTPVSNVLAGVAIQSGAQNNRIGDTSAGAGNLISGNLGNGVFIGDPTTSGNWVLGNIIGPNTVITDSISQDQGLNGIEINDAGGNFIGDGTVNGRNIISGNRFDGIALTDSSAMSNTIQGNYIGTDNSGTLPISNLLHGIEIRQGANNNLIGGNRASGAGNLLSGNGNHGLVINGADDNIVAGNIIGADVTGSFSLGNQPNGGMDITNADGNIIGGLAADEGNLISGNQRDGIALFGNVNSTQILSNRIGISLQNNNPLPNTKLTNGQGGQGIINSSSVFNTLIQGNVIAYNQGPGIEINGCNGNTVTKNAIFGHEPDSGIKTICSHSVSLTALSTTVITGTTNANATVEIFSDDEDEGRLYEGTVIADGSGHFTFTKPGGFTAQNLTATSIDLSANTSRFSTPLHLRWTLLLYLNGDNDLEEFMQNTQNSLALVSPNKHTNLIVLLDQHGDHNTELYDLTYGLTATLPLTTTILPITSTGGLTDELNMGDGQTLVNFVNWGRNRYPVSYTMLSIVDHGGGWAPSNNLSNTIGTLFPRKRRGWLAGGSGLSWDETTHVTTTIGLTNSIVVTDFDYLDSIEIRQSMSSIEVGNGPLDVLFYDVCLMGMLEVAYQIQDHADYFVSSQNIGWAPLGEDNRYNRLLSTMPPNATPRDMASHMVNSYAAAMPPNGHPFTVSAIDLAQLPGLTTAVSNLGNSISATLSVPTQMALLQNIYSNTQKVDYDSDFKIEPTQEGFVDLYDLALNLTQQHTNTAVIAAAQIVSTTTAAAIVAEAHYSGSPWFDASLYWDLDDVSGLSIFLPLGEDLEYNIFITETSSISPALTITRPLRLRDLYTANELQFVADTSGWASFIDTHYEVLATPVPTNTPNGPVDGLQAPDFLPPTTTIAFSGPSTAGAVITITWVTTDTQTGVYSTTLWHKLNNDDWVNPHPTQTTLSGVFTATLGCGINRFSVRATDVAGNVEPFDNNHLNSTTFSTTVSGLSLQHTNPVFVGDNVLFTATVSNGCDVSYLWQFSEGITVTADVTITRQYTQTGNYTITVTAQNPANSITTFSSLTVLEAQIQGLTATNDSPTALGNMTTLTAVITNGSHVTYTWNFGDGQMGNGQVVTHPYNAPGTYTATVTAVNAVSAIS